MLFILNVLKVEELLINENLCTNYETEEVTIKETNYETEEVTIKEMNYETEEVTIKETNCSLF